MPVAAMVVPEAAVAAAVVAMVAILVVVLTVAFLSVSVLGKVPPSLLTLAHICRSWRVRSYWRLDGGGQEYTD